MKLKLAQSVAEKSFTAEKEEDAEKIKNVSCPTSLLPFLRILFILRGEILRLYRCHFTKRNSAEPYTACTKASHAADFASLG